MKSLLIISAKGSSGRTTLTCLLARHLQCTCHWRVLVLDLAEPPRCAQMLAGRGHGTTGSGNRVPDLPECANPIRGGCLRVLSADAIDALHSRDDPARTRYYANLRQLLSAVAPWFDVCLIDAPVLPDLRAVCAEALADAVLSPLSMSPECIECASAVINGTYGIRNVRARLNPALRFAGLLPVFDVPSPMEEAWAKVMKTTLHEWLIVDPAFPHGYAWLPRMQSVMSSVGRIEQRLEPHGDPIALDVGVAEASRTVTACLNVLTRWLDAIGNDLCTALAMRRCAMHDAAISFDFAGPGRALLRALRRWSSVIAAFIGVSILVPGTARADDWGCQVILCLSNPGGPEQYGECVPPVEKLWAALRHGDPFPTCDFGAGGSQGTSAVNIFAGAGYCREDLLYWGGPEQSELLCNARGAINIEIDGALYTRVWWDARGADRTITEFYGGGITQVSYDPTQSMRLFLEREYENSGGHGGGR